MTALEETTNQTDFLVRLWHRKYVVALGALIGLVFAVIYLNIATYKFQAELRVTPSAASKSPTLASAVPNVGGLASIAGISLGGSTTASPFDIYLDAILSRDVAIDLSRDPRIMQAIFKKDWDTSLSRWREPVSATREVTTTIKRILGVPVRSWRPPGAAELQDYLLRSIEVYKSNTSPITRIQYKDVDPNFANYLLERMNASADRKVRDDALIQSREYATYLSQRLAVVVLSELRTRIADQLSRQEELIMIASSNVPFAAAPLEPPTVSERPTTPQPKLVLPIGLLVGAALGAAAAQFMPSRQRQKHPAPVDSREPA